MSGLVRDLEAVHTFVSLDGRGQIVEVWFRKPGVGADLLARLGAVETLRSIRIEPGGIASLADWPITYDEIEPYLSKIEWEFGCSGLATGRHEVARSRDYPCPPPPVTAYGMRFYEACARLGIDGIRTKCG